MDTIYVSEEGLKEFLEELEKKRKILQKNLQFQGEAIRSAPGDSWHDNFAFEDAVREERRISNELQKMILDKEKLKIIHENSNKKNIVYLESVLLIRFFYDQEEYEDEWIKITGKYFPNLNSPIKEITINSPLGKALYLKKIGSKVKYVANQKDLQVEILEKR